MKTLSIIVLSLLSVSSGFGKIINVPADIDSIQGGIDLAVNGDTVLVQPGTYVENIHFNSKSIVVGSLFLTTGDTSYISKTVIDGNNYGCVVSFQNGITSETVLSGFVITKGAEVEDWERGGYVMGCGIFCEYANPRLEHLILKENHSSSGAGIDLHTASPIITNVMIRNNSGSGFYCENSSPALTNVMIQNNSGSGLYCEGSSPVLMNVTIKDNTGCGICCRRSSPYLSDVTIANNSKSGIRLEQDSSPIFDEQNRCNIYLNQAAIGNDILSNMTSVITVIVDTFTVKNPTDYHAFPISQFRFDILHGKVEQTNADLYVSPAGDNANNGLSASAPLKTIRHAFSKILVDSLNPHTIHLANGRYSPSTNGEYFPVQMQNYTHLSGESQKNVILDAEAQSEVMTFGQINGITVENMTITGGSRDIAGGHVNLGFGIGCWKSSPDLKNLTIKNNESSGIDCESSNPFLTDVEIINNVGSGISCYSSTPVLTNVNIIGNRGGIYCRAGSNLKTKNVLIAENSAENGAGIYLDMCSPDLSDVTIRKNSARSHGGGIYCYGSSPTLTNTILDGNSAGEKGGGIYSVYLNYLKLMHVTMTGNTAASGSGIFGEQHSNLTLVNSILWDDPQQKIVIDGSAMIAYSDVQGGQSSIVNNNENIYWLEGNIDADPLFADSVSFHLSKNSPCIDAGIQDTLLIYDTGQNLFVPPMQYLSDAPDMGAVEFDPSTSVVSTSKIIPEKFALFQNYPNPFNPSTTIEYDLPKPNNVRLDIYDLLGRHVKTLVSTQQQAGHFKATWDSTDGHNLPVAVGLYFCRMEAGSPSSGTGRNFVKVIKLVLAK